MQIMQITGDYNDYSSRKIRTLLGWLASWRYSYTGYWRAGDSGEKAYSETYARVNSLVTVTEKLNTGKRNEKGEIIYYSHSYKVNRVTRLDDMLEISPLIYDAFYLLVLASTQTWIATTL